MVEHTFGDARSLTGCRRPNICISVARAVDGAGVAGRELVLEVEELSSAVEFDTTLGFELVDDGRDEGRVRLSTGDLDLESWSPRLGIADARGGVHVDFGVVAEDPKSTAREVADDALAVTSVDEGVQIRDRDGHYLTLVSA